MPVVPYSQHGIPYGSLHQRGYRGCYLGAGERSPIGKARLGVLTVVILMLACIGGARLIESLFYLWLTSPESRETPSLPVNRLSLSPYLLKRNGR